MKRNGSETDKGYGNMQLTLTSEVPAGGLSVPNPFVLEKTAPLD